MEGSLPAVRTGCAKNTVLVSALSPDRLARDNDLHSPVLLPADGGIIAGHRIGRSHTHGSDRVRVQSLLYEEHPYCVRPLSRKFEIELIAARAVGVTRNF